MQGFALDTEGGDRAGFKPLVRNVSAAAFTRPVCGGVHSLQSFVDLLEQFPFALPNSHGKILVDFSGGLVTDVGKCLEVASMGQDFPHIIENSRALALEGLNRNREAEAAYRQMWRSWCASS